MSNSRGTTFASIRRSLGVKGDERSRLAIVEDRLDRSPKGIIPTRAQIDAPARLALMLAKLEGVQATSAVLTSAAEVPAAVAEYLRANNLPATLRRGDDSRLESLPWAGTALEVATEAMRIHGGYGYSTEYVLERLYRDAPLLCIGEGTNELQRIIIAKQLIKRNPV